MMPLRLKDRVNSGRMAGLLNGFCYLGSTVTSYGLGAIADGFGWASVFYVLLAAAATAAVRIVVIVAAMTVAKTVKSVSKIARKRLRLNPLSKLPFTRFPLMLKKCRLR